MDIRSRKCGNACGSYGVIDSKRSFGECVPKRSLGTSSPQARRGLSAFSLSFANRFGFFGPSGNTLGGWALHPGSSLGGRALGVTRLIEHHGKVSRHAEVRHQPEARIRNALGELDTAGLQLGDCFLDIVTIEGNVVGSGRRTFRSFHRMASHIRLGKIKDQPALANVGKGETELVAHKGTKLLRLRGVEHGVNACNHGNPFSFA